MMTTIQKDTLAITVSEWGAELISVKHRGKERIWQNENGEWSGHAPVLFPVCGACEVRVAGKVYACPRHGFAMHERFTLTEKSENRLTYRLISDARTKKLYPYDFILEVSYEIAGDELKITYEVHNPSKEELYFSCGGHDSFALESEMENYELVFEKEEKFASELVTEDGYLTGESRALGVGKILDLRTDLLENSNSICLDRLNSRSVILREKTTEKRVAEVRFPTAQKLVLWRPKGAKMLCIEPWQNLPDEVGCREEFPQKDGIIQVMPDGKASVTRTIKYD